MLFYYSDNQTIYFYRNTETLEIVWWDPTRVMSDGTFMDELSQVYDFIIRKHPKNLFINLQKMFHHVRPDFIPFICNKFKGIENAAIEKIAIIKSDDSTTQRVMEEIIQNSSLVGYNIHIFNEEDAAIDWLHEDENTSSKIRVA